jgi:hypothetical protein
MRGKDDDQNLDSSEIKISMFILLIRFNHSTCNAHPICPHQMKRNSPLLWATRSRWQKLAQQTYSSELTRASVPAEDGSQQLSTFTHVHQGPVSKYLLMPILIINKKMRHKQ